MHSNKIKTFKTYKNQILTHQKSSKLKFLVDGRVHYVYRVTNILTEQYYYGSHSIGKSKRYNKWHKISNVSRTYAYKVLNNEHEYLFEKKPSKRYYNEKYKGYKFFYKKVDNEN